MRSGRPLGFDPAVALDGALSAFWTYGYAAATTQVLESATSLSRSSLLNSFGTKEELLLAALDRYQEMVDSVLLAPLLHQGGLDAVEDFFGDLAELKASGSGTAGCLVVNLAGESPNPSPGVQSRIERYEANLADAFSTALARAAADEEMPAELVDTRVQVLTGLAISINWMARARGHQRAMSLAEAATQQVREWRRHGAGSGIHA